MNLQWAALRRSGLLAALQQLMMKLHENAAQLGEVLATPGIIQNRRRPKASGRIWAPNYACGTSSKLEVSSNERAASLMT